MTTSKRFPLLATAFIAAMIGWLPLSRTTEAQQPVSVTQMSSAAALADNTSNPTVGGLAAYLMCFDGSTWDRCPTSTGGSGTVDANTSRVVIATDQAALTGLGIYTEDAGETAGGNLSMAGSVRRDTLASSAGSSGDNATLNTDATGALYVANVGATNGGGSIANVASAASTNATSVKASAGQVYGIYLVNTTATLYYLRLYNLSTSPTCSSSTGYVTTVPIPASTTGAGISMPIPIGAAFGTGVAYCITGGASSTDNTNAATGIYGSIIYK